MTSDYEIRWQTGNYGVEIRFLYNYTHQKAVKVGRQYAERDGSPWLLVNQQIHSRIDAKGKPVNWYVVSGMDDYNRMLRYMKKHGYDFHADLKSLKRISDMDSPFYVPKTPKKKPAKKYVMYCKAKVPGGMDYLKREFDLNKTDSWNEARVLAALRKSPWIIFDDKVYVRKSNSWKPATQTEKNEIYEFIRDSNARYRQKWGKDHWDVLKI